MSMFAGLVRVEAKLLIRDTLTLLLTLLLPAVLILIFGSIGALREPSPELGGRSFIQVWAPSMVVLITAMLALQAFPTQLATYRERGILRRLSTTPVSPSLLLAAQLLVNMVLAAVSVALMIVVAAAAFDVPMPQHPIGFLLTLVLGTSAIFALGLVVAAITPSPRAAAGIGLLVFFPVMFFGGVYVPTEFLPSFLETISSYVPPSVQALQEAWIGTGAEPLQLGAMLLCTAIFGAVAARTFRWD